MKVSRVAVWSTAVLGLVAVAYLLATVQRQRRGLDPAVTTEHRSPGPSWACSVEAPVVPASESLRAIVEVQQVGQPLGTISGKVRGQRTPGVERPDARVHLAMPEDGFAASAIRWTRAQNDWIGSYEFKGLPPGEYWVELHPGTIYATDPPGKARAFPGDRVDFLVLDEVELVDVAFLVADAESGVKLDGVTARLSVGKGPRPWGPWKTNLRGEDLVIRNVPLGAPMHWLLAKEGFITAVGGWDDLEASPTGDRLRRANVRLEHGYEITVLVERLDEVPIRGAQVLCDGEVVGVTDEEGYYTLRRTERPVSAAIRHLDWEFLDTSSSEVLNDPSEWGDGSHAAIVFVMAPPAVMRGLSQPR